MDIDKIFVAIFSVVGILFTYWFFLMKKEAASNAVKAEGSIDIVVKGGYEPSVIEVPKGKTTKISFTRKDSSTCLEEVVLGDFKIRKFLPLNKKVTVEVTPQRAGEFNFTCGMNMFHGKIIVS